MKSQSILAIVVLMLLLPQYWSIQDRQTRRFKRNHRRARHKMHSRRVHPRNRKHHRTIRLSKSIVKPLFQQKLNINIKQKQKNSQKLKAKATDNSRLNKKVNTKTKTKTKVNKKAKTKANNNSRLNKMKKKQSVATEAQLKELRQKINDVIYDAGRKAGLWDTGYNTKGEPRGQCRIFKKNRSKLKVQYLNNNLPNYQKKYLAKYENLIKTNDREHFMNYGSYKYNNHASPGKCISMYMLDMHYNKEVLGSRKDCDNKKFTGDDQKVAGNIYWSDFYDEKQYYDNESGISDKELKKMNELYVIPNNQPFYSESKVNMLNKGSNPLGLMILVRYQMNSCLVFEFQESEKDEMPTLGMNIGQRLKLIFAFKLIPQIQKLIGQMEDELQRQHMAMYYCSYVFYANKDNQVSYDLGSATTKGEALKHPYQAFTITGAMLAQYFNPFIAIKREKNAEKKTLEQVMSKEGYQLYRKIEDDTNTQFYGKYTSQRYQFYKQSQNYFSWIHTEARKSPLNYIKSCLYRREQSICSQEIFKKINGMYGMTQKIYDRSPKWAEFILEDYKLQGKSPNEFIKEYGAEDLITIEEKFNDLADKFNKLVDESMIENINKVKDKMADYFSEDFMTYSKGLGFFDTVMCEYDIQVTKQFFSEPKPDEPEPEPENNDPENKDDKPENNNPENKDDKPENNNPENKDDKPENQDDEPGDDVPTVVKLTQDREKAGDCIKK